MSPRAGVSPATQSSTSKTPTGSTNGGKNTEALVRSARAWMTRHGVEMSQAKLSRLIRGYEPDEHGADEHSLSQWLESRCFDTTGATAAFRADLRRQVVA